MTPDHDGVVDAHLREDTLQSEQVYLGRFLDVRRDQVRLPDGSTAQREYIVHPGAVVVVPMLADGRAAIAGARRIADTVGDPKEQAKLRQPLDDVAVVGHDSGGMIARHAVAGDPRLRAMGLIDTEQTHGLSLRFKLFLVIAVLLFGAVVGLPLLIQDDGTARGFTQIILTYTLSAITALLGLSTLWLACGTLARDIEECQMQVVAVKPIARWRRSTCVPPGRCSSFTSMWFSAGYDMNMGPLSSSSTGGLITCTWPHR